MKNLEKLTGFLIERLILYRFHFSFWHWSSKSKTKQKNLPLPAFTELTMGCDGRSLLFRSSNAKHVENTCISPILLPSRISRWFLLRNGGWSIRTESRSSLSRFWCAHFWRNSRTDFRTHRMRDRDDATIWNKVKIIDRMKLDHGRRSRWSPETVTAKFTGIYKAYELLTVQKCFASYWISKLSVLVFYSLLIFPIAIFERNSFPLPHSYTWYIIIDHKNNWPLKSLI